MDHQQDAITLDATALADFVRRKKLQPLELGTGAIERIEHLNPALNSVVTNTGVLLCRIRLETDSRS